VCGVRLVAKVALCAPATVMFHKDWRGCLYLFRLVFQFNRPTLFLFNENGSLLPCLKKEQANNATTTDPRLTRQGHGRTLYHYFLWKVHLKHEHQ
jgi:hypothetical protein